MINESIIRLAVYNESLTEQLQKQLDSLEASVEWKRKMKTDVPAKTARKKLFDFFNEDDDEAEAAGETQRAERKNKETQSYVSNTNDTGNQGSPNIEARCTVCKFSRQRQVSETDARH